jgi:hypothetical protein
MQIEWRQTNNTDGGQALFGAFKVTDIEEASNKATRAIKIIKSHRNDKYSHISLSHEGLSIMLHGTSRDKLEDKDWAIAEEIRTALNDEV